MAQEQTKNRSIHPRVGMNGRTLHNKVNTAKPARPGLKPQTLENMRKHFAEHPHDGETAKRLSKNK